MNEAKGGVGAYLLVMLIAGGGGFYLGTQSEGAKPSEVDIDCNSEEVKECLNAEPIYKIAIGDAATKGSADAKVTIVEVSDFQCPFCSRVNATMKKVHEGKYGKDIRVAFFHNPLGFHKNAMPAAIAAEAAGLQGKFWEMHDKLFDNQRDLTASNFEKWAEELGLDTAKFKTDLKDAKLEKKIKAQQAAVVKLGARGTPAFFINGRFLSGAQPVSKFEEVIAAALKDAEKQIKRGVKPSAVYAKIIANGATSKVDKPAAPGANRPKPPAPPPDTRQNVPAKKDHRGKGAWPAKVTIVEYSDFECSFCSRGAKVAEQILKAYPKDVFFIYKHNPLGFHKNAEPAARAAEAAGLQGKFYPMHDKMFADQRNLTQENFDKWAGEIGLNMAQFKKDMNSDVVKKQVQTDAAEARKVGARGTPNFFVNGVPVRGALPFDSFKTKIDAEIKKADALLKKGTKLKDIYAAIMKDAGKPVGPSFKLPTAPKKPTGPVKIADHPEDMAYGPKNAKVTIYEFSDFQCPFCSKGAEAMDQVKKEFGDKVRIVFKNLPLGFHQHAELAARAAHAAGKQGKFWAMHDILFKNQRSLGDEQIKGYAGEIGLDVAKWEKDLNSDTTKAKIEADKALATKVGVRGTPNFYVNGEHVAGAQPFSRFKEMIGKHLAKN